MDDFKKEQTKQCGIGGLHCPCCNKNARGKRNKKRKQLNKTARRRTKKINWG